VLPNCIDNQLDIVIQLVIAKPHDRESTRLQPRCSLRIVRDGFWILVLRSIKLNDELSRKADKVNDVRADSRLTAKLATMQLLSAK
jgi:hypothetical protein